MKVVIFSVAGKDYGAPIGQIVEVLRMRTITPVPDTAPFIEGVICLRGTVLPLINLRKKLELENHPPESGRILLANLHDLRIGILVERVREVAAIPDNAITQPDPMLQSADYLQGVAKWKGGLILLIDLELLVRNDDHADLQSVQHKVAVKQKGPDSVSRL
jgi:purine-binding chemotaxis protein CheW